ncbi:hypothetical protein AAFF_G00146370 [Aldrovandia affinis]|uniref:Uncharacterized protein n=1 Tax=Aldrovandia affinis TaxID=143900 RepID=A0AAD7RSE7_9TELE|nr:hypothetical protein AAFF_G00146370 [Aldrovandia affinis]
MTAELLPANPACNTVGERRVIHVHQAGNSHLNETTGKEDKTTHGAGGRLRAKAPAWWSGLRSVSRGSSVTFRQLQAQAALIRRQTWSWESATASALF